jgi:serine protease inhibitor
MVLKTLLGIFLLAQLSLSSNPHTLRAGDDADVQSNYKFTQLELNIMKRFLDTLPEASITFSPLSIRSMLAMLLLGAGGETQMLLKELVGDDRSARRILASPLKSGISMGNALFFSYNLDISDQFHTTLTNRFHAEFQYVDFTKPDKTAFNVNEWVRRITNKSIAKVVDGVSPDTTFLMINAIHLVANWRDPFETIETKDGVFYEFGQTSENNNLSPKLTPIMRQTNDYKIGHVKSLEARVLEIPFRTPENHAMYIVLPDNRDGLKDVVQRLSPNSLNEILNSLETTPVNLWLPKFTGSVHRKLRGILPHNTNSLFTNNANFSRISTNQNVNINEITHKAILKVGEEGAVGSTVTIAEAVSYSYTPQTNFNVSHPFLYFIVEMEPRDESVPCGSKNLEIYFMGFVGKIDQSKPLPPSWGPLA